MEVCVGVSFANVGVKLKCSKLKYMLCRLYMNYLKMGIRSNKQTLLESCLMKCYPQKNIVSQYRNVETSSYLLHTTSIPLFLSKKFCKVVQHNSPTTTNNTTVN